MRKPLGLLLALSVFSAGAADLETRWHLVGGKDLRETFSDRELGDGAHYAYRFNGDGTLTGMDMGKPTRGVWKTKGSSLCYSWKRPGNETECYEVRRRGNEVRMFRDGHEVFSGTLTPITNPTSKE